MSIYNDFFVIERAGVAVTTYSR